MKFLRSKVWFVKVKYKYRKIIHPDEHFRIFDNLKRNLQNSRWSIWISITFIHRGWRFFYKEDGFVFDQGSSLGWILWTALKVVFVWASLIYLMLAPYSEEFAKSGTCTQLPVTQRYTLCNFRYFCFCIVYSPDFLNTKYQTLVKMS